MRTSTVVALTLAASASIIAPALARPAATSRIGYETPRIGHPINGAFHANRDDALAARALQFPMPGEQSRWNAMHHGRAEPTSDSEAISFGKIIKGVLHFLKREDDMVARAFEDELLARGHEQYHEMNHAPSTYNHAHTYAQRSARAFDDELYARAYAAEGSEALNVGKILKGVLHFLKREDDMVARAFEDELLARGDEGYHEMNHAPSTSNHAHTYAQHLARAFNDELYARADAAEGSEALNVGKILKGVLHFLKRDDLMIARAFEGELLERGHEGFHVGYEPTGLHYAGHHARAFDDELLARADAAQGSDALNFGKIVKGILHFLKRDDPLLARAFEDELMARSLDELD